MKKFFTLIAVLAMTVVANANLTVEVIDPVVATSDGTPITVKVNGGNVFETFCVESLVLGGSEQYPLTAGIFSATIDDVIIGGSPYAESPNYLSDTTKKLYAAWLNGAVAQAASQVQSWIYTIESVGITSAAADAYVATLSASDVAGYQYVKVLNIGEKDPSDGIKDHQSVLIRVPAPGAVLLSGLGTVLVGLVRRRSL